MRAEIFYRKNLEKEDFSTKIFTRDLFGPGLKLEPKPQVLNVNQV
jgi:hypothetical protein